MTVAPMRYSVSQPDFDPELGCRLIIRVNGTELKDVSAYDAEAGWVERLERDIEGKPVLLKARGEFAIERVKGAVAVDLLPEGGGPKV